MLRILFDASDSGLQPVGGVSRICNEILERMAKANPDFRFLLVVPTMKGQRLPKHPSIRILREFRLPRRRLFAIANKILRARTAFCIRSFHAHVYQLSHYQSPRAQGIPTVALVHDFIDANTFNGMSGNELGIVRYTDVPAEKIRVARLGVGDSFFSDAPASKQGPSAKTHNSKPYFLFVGSRFGYKNFGTLLRAWAAICQSGLGCRLVCVGGQDHLEAWEMDFLINAKLVRDFVMAGKLSDDALRRIYAEAVAFIFPSLAEGFGLPLVEAMAAGCQVIASDIPAFREIADKSVLLFDPYSVDDLAAAMRWCLENPQEPAIASAAKDHARSFSWDKTAAVFAQTYRALAKQQQPNPARASNLSK